MSISAEENTMQMKRGICLYLGTAMMSLLIFLVYDRFSHGVRSFYMTFLWLWPLVFGVLPCALFAGRRGLLHPGQLAVNLWNSGVAALCVSSLLRGIFEIAGTASVLQTWLFGTGLAFMISGLLAYLGFDVWPQVRGNGNHSYKTPL